MICASDEIHGRTKPREPYKLYRSKLKIFVIARRKWSSRWCCAQPHLTPKRLNCFFPFAAVVLSAFSRYILSCPLTSMNRYLYSKSDSPRRLVMWRRAMPLFLCPSTWDELVRGRAKISEKGIHGSASSNAGSLVHPLIGLNCKWVSGYRGFRRHTFSNVRNRSRPSPFIKRLFTMGSDLLGVSEQL